MVVNFFRKNIRVLILPLIAVVVAVYFFGFYNDVDDVVLESGGVIERQADRFYPNNVIVQKGDAIRFVNLSDKYFWPASDLHPSHSVYSKFDPQKPIAPNQSWEFRFDRAGEWNFHDHLTPHIGGRVIVLGSEEEKPPVDCSGESGNRDCWRTIIFEVLDAEGVDSAYDVVKELYTTEDSFKSSCHAIAHDIGLRSYVGYLEDKDSVSTPKTAACAYGFYHGFMEALLTATDDMDQARSFCLNLDEEVVATAPDATLQCFHGIGHGAVDLALSIHGFGGNQEALVNKSIEVCEATSITQEEIYRCTSGVYNSVANTYTEESFLDFNKEDPLELCRTQPEAYKESCYGNMNTLLFWLNDDDFSKAASMVEIIEDAHQVQSMRYVAGMGTIDTIIGNPQYDDSVATCRSLGEFHSPCIEGISQGLLEHGIPGEEYIQAIDFCSSDSLTSEEKHICFKYALAGLPGWYDIEKTRTICSSVDPLYQDYCNMY